MADGKIIAMDKSSRLKILLNNGYFPRELPPPFNTSDLAKYRLYVKNNWPAGDASKTSPAMLSIPRMGFKRRQLSIINPISQYHLAELISEHWTYIKSFMDKSQSSLDCPNLRGGIERAIPKPDFSRIELKKIETSAEYDHILYTDISRFYGSIYTHVIPWALHGKDLSKTTMHDTSFKSSIGNKIDVAVRKCQDNQTIGIPIGPDTSRIISEIVAIGIENRFEHISNVKMSRVFRYVDDWFIGFDTKDQSERAISDLSSSCTYFELELNIEKTKIVDPRSHPFSCWPEELHAIYRMEYKDKSRKIRHYFEKAFEIAAEYPNDNVLDYAIKMARGFDVDRSSYLLFESYVLRVARSSKISIPVVCQIVVSYQNKWSIVSKDRCKKFIKDTLRQSMPHGHYYEVSWSLFLARELGIILDVDDFNEISTSDNSVCALISLDLLDIGLISGALDTEYWRSLMTKDSLRNGNWLLSYEADLKGWIPHATLPGHVESDPWFRVLKAKKISFYDRRRSVPTFADSARLQRVIARNRSDFFLSLFKFVQENASV